jgi:hypothetical protein
MIPFTRQVNSFLLLPAQVKGREFTALIRECVPSVFPRNKGTGVTLLAFENSNGSELG